LQCPDRLHMGRLLFALANSAELAAQNTRICGTSTAAITEGCNARKVSTIEPDAAIEAAGRIARHRWVFSRACPIACDRYARRRQSFDTSIPTVIFSLATVLV